MRLIGLSLGAVAMGVVLGAVASANATEIAYHFDRNAFAATARAGDGTYVALTDTANLLAFDPATYAVLAERVPQSPVTCLAATSDGVVAGLDDGRIVSVDVPSLAMKRVGAVDGRPAWIGRRRSGALLVAHGFAPEKPFGWGRRGLASLVVEELATGRSFRVPFVATTFLLDSRERLWLGADNGEWGGRIAVIDLASWAVRELEHPPSGVYGLIETAGGRVLAHGGTMHMGMHQAFVSAVDGAEGEPLYDSGFVTERRRDRPTLPITHLVALRGGRAFLAFAYDQVFQVDAKLTRWRRLPDFEARYEPGRPDAVGDYPALRSIYLLGESPPHALLATARDGWVELRDGRYIPRKVVGQLAARDVVFASRGWRPVEATSPVLLPSIARSKGQPRHVLHRAADGKVVGVFYDQPEGQSDDGAHLLVTAACEAGACRALGQETTKLTPETTFLTPEGALWALDEKGLWSFRDGRWSVVLAGQEPSAGLGFGARVVPTKAAPWLLDGHKGTKLLWPGDRQTPPGLVAVAGMAVKGEHSEERDFVECAGHRYALKDGRVCEIDDQGACAPTAIAGARWPQRLGCDGGGQLWLGGYGLARVEHGVAVPFHELDRYLGGREVRLLGRDIGAGLEVVIEDRGVAVIDPPQPAPPAPARAPDEGDRGRDDHVRQAVFLWTALEKPRPMIEELDASLRAAGAGGYGGVRETGYGYESPRFFSFYGRDARRLVELIRPRIEQAGRSEGRREGKSAVLFRRDGEPGVRPVRIDLAPSAPGD